MGAGLGTAEGAALGRAKVGNSVNVVGLGVGFIVGCGVGTGVGACGVGTGVGAPGR